MAEIQSGKKKIKLDSDLDDYERRAPDNQTHEGDEKMVGAWKCPDCGGEGMTYHPFAKYMKGKIFYRPFAACHNCGLAFEF